MNRTTRHLLTAAITLSAILASAPLARADKNDARLGFSAGPWWGSMTEDYLGASSEVTLAPAIGFEFRLGQYFKSIFFDWSPTLLNSWTITGGDRSGQSSYGSVFALNGGLSFMRMNPAFPLEVYVGIESGNIHFNNGIQVSYTGSTLKFGADYLPFRYSTGNRIGFTAQYRVTSISEDTVGRLPSGTSVHLHLYYVGVLLHFGSEGKELRPSSPEL